MIELDDKLFAKLSKDPTRIQKLQSKGNAKAKGHIDEMVKIVKTTDGKASVFDPKTAEIFSRNLNADLEKRMGKAGAEMAKETEALFEDYKKGKGELRDFRIKSAGKIAFNSISIAASAGGAVASGGGVAPLAIVGIVKSALTISQECLKLALSADQFAKIVQAELKALGEFMNKNIEKAKTSGKIAQGVK